MFTTAKKEVLISLWVVWLISADANSYAVRDLRHFTLKFFYYEFLLDNFTKT